MKYPSTMDKLENFVKSYDCSLYDTLPKFLKRRVDALKKIQLEHVQLQTQFHKELQELEMKYEKLYLPLYEKRQQIINGDYNPTDEDCQLPPSVTENECDGDQENSEELKAEPIITAEEEKSLESTVKGIPGFWLGTLLSSYNFADSIEFHDRPVLRHLTDIKLSYEDTEAHLIYKLDFLFDENPYFTNKVLTKTYHLKKTPDEKDPFSYDGYEVCKSEGCVINWNPGKDVTQETVTVKQKNKNDGRQREKKKEVERDSFFFFFKPPAMPDTSDPANIDEELASVITIDFELGEIIRQYIIPKAVLYYAGYMVEDYNDSDDGDDDDELDYDDESDDSDLDDSDDSDDSLEEAGKDKKKLLAAKNKGQIKKSP